MQKIGCLLPHMLIVFSLFLGTLWVLDQLNPMMGFLDNTISDAATIVFCVLALIQGVCSVIRRYTP